MRRRSDSPSGEADGPGGGAAVSPGMGRTWTVEGARYGGKSPKTAVATWAAPVHDALDEAGLRSSREGRNRRHARRLLQEKYFQVMTRDPG